MWLRFTGLNKSGFSRRVRPMNLPLKTSHGQFPLFYPSICQRAAGPERCLSFMDEKFEILAHVNTDQRPCSGFYHRISSISVSFISFTDGKQIMFHTRALWPCGIWGFELSLHTWQTKPNLRGSKCTELFKSGVWTRTNKKLINPQKG